MATEEIQVFVIINFYNISVYYSIIFQKVKSVLIIKVKENRFENLRNFMDYPKTLIDRVMSTLGVHIESFTVLS